MKRPHLLAVEAPAATFAPLLGAARAAGLRIGWLESAEPAPAAPATLEDAAAAGALRAVAVGPGRTLALKPLAGPPVLHDLLREHFLGCAAVLVHGPLAPPDAPRLAPTPAGAWRLTAPDGTDRHLATDDLLARLRKPRWETGKEEKTEAG